LYKILSHQSGRGGFKADVVMNSSPLKSGSVVKATGWYREITELLTAADASGGNTTCCAEAKIKILLFFNGITDTRSQHGAMVE
jgi:hypothetical protein